MGLPPEVKASQISRPHDKLNLMGTKDVLNSRSREELIELATRLAASDSDLRWALIQARKRAGFTQSDLAEVLGVSQPAVAQIESMGNDPRLSTLRRYALAVGAMISHQVTESNGRGFSTDHWTSLGTDDGAITFVTRDTTRRQVSAQWRTFDPGDCRLSLDEVA